MSKLGSLRVILSILIIAFPRVCFANVFDDLGEAISSVTGLRGIAKGMASGAGEGFREQIEKLIDSKINPLLDRANAIAAQRLDQVDAIMAARIEQTANEMVRTLHEAEGALNNIVDHIAARAGGLIDRAFQDANDTLDRLFVKVDPLINDILCHLGPARRGLQITGIPFTRQPDEIRVRWPARTHCYQKHLASRSDKNPASEVFSGWEFFIGEMCEVEVNAGDISASDPDANEKLKAAYERAAGLAASAICYAPTPTSRSDLLTKELQFETKVRFFSRLLNGSSVLLK